MSERYTRTGERDVDCKRSLPAVKMFLPGRKRTIGFRMFNVGQMFNL